MSTVKQQLLDRLAQEQPDSPVSKAIRQELETMEQIIQRGLEDSKQGRVISNAEMKKHIEQLTARDGCFLGVNGLPIRESDFG